MLTPRRPRGLVHPVRVRLLHLLETDGPGTASLLGRRIGQSSGITSYHLRLLADLGFIEEDTGRGNGRDRWWRTRYRSSAFTFGSPDDPADRDSLDQAEQYLRLVWTGTTGAWSGSWTAWPAGWTPWLRCRGHSASPAWN